MYSKTHINVVNSTVNSITETVCLIELLFSYIDALIVEVRPLSGRIGG